MTSLHGLPVARLLSASGLYHSSYACTVMLACAGIQCCTDSVMNVCGALVGLQDAP